MNTYTKALSIALLTSCAYLPSALAATIVSNTAANLSTIEKNDDKLVRLMPVKVGGLMRLMPVKVGGLMRLMPVKVGGLMR